MKFVATVMKVTLALHTPYKFGTSRLRNVWISGRRHYVEEHVNERGDCRVLLGDSDGNDGDTTRALSGAQGR